MRIRVFLLWTFSMLILVGVRDSQVAAQDDLHGPEQRDEHVEVVNRLDRDRNGILNPDEIPEIAVSFVQELAKELGIDHSKPIDLKELQNAHKQAAVEREARNHHRRIHDEQVELLRRMDRNGNGVLKPNEIPSEAKSFVARLVKDAGLNPNKGIKLDKFAAAHAERFEELPAGHHDGTAFVAAHATPISKADAMQYAEGLTAHLDQNENGVLEKKEWNQLHKAWGEADANKDGKISVDELASELMSLSQQVEKEK